MLQKDDMMKKTITTQPEIKLVGMKTRTCNKDEMNWETGKLFPCIQAYSHQGIAQTIQNRKKPGTTLCLYTGYESDHNGFYTYFIGEEVESFENIPEGLEKHVIPAQKYVKFTTEPGAMPDVVKEPWLKIWEMTPAELGGERAYLSDFEIYDERAADHQNVVLDILIGIRD